MATDKIKKRKRRVKVGRVPTVRVFCDDYEIEVPPEEGEELAEDEVLVSYPRAGQWVIFRKRMPAALAKIMVEAQGLRTDAGGGIDENDPETLGALARIVADMVPILADQVEAWNWLDYNQEPDVQLDDDGEPVTDDDGDPVLVWPLMPEPDEDALWASLQAQGRLTGRRAPGPLVVRRSDRAGGSMTLKRGRHPVTVTGRPSELTLLLLGRAQLRDLDYQGAPDAVAALRGADFSF